VRCGVAANRCGARASKYPGHGESFDLVVTRAAAAGRSCFHRHPAGDPRDIRALRPISLLNLMIA